ncbi:MAG: gliding motility protein GldM [Bacteroidales bacterium]|nr:gliding motility protein GldM [Bacteroidales bacterium]
MAAYKETPRQKMIAMMYLVLTALLALNVSREMLHAFLVVNESMEETNEKFYNKIDDTYSEFQTQLSINPGKVQEYWDRALNVQQLTNNLVGYLDSVKYTIISQTEGITMEEAKVISLPEVKKKDNFDRPTTFFIGAEYKGEAYTIKEKLNKYRADLLEIVEENNKEDRETFDGKLGLKTDGTYLNADGVAESWELHHFYHTILIADLTILNKFITEIYNSEHDLINYLYSSITEEDFKFDEIGAKVIPNSNYIFQGDDYKAEILVAAYDTKQIPKVYILEGADTLTSANISKAREIPGELGKGTVPLVLPGTSEGTKKYAGIIRILTPAGKTEDYHFKHSYLVAKPSATISPTKMNVFYRGVDNPVAISASGKSDAQLSPEITAGSLVRSESGWVVKSLPAEVLNATIKVYADDNGGRRFMGEQEFRVKKLPDPIAKVMGTSDGKISRSRLLANPFLVCLLPEWVDFKYDFKVTSFMIFIPLGGGYYSTEKSDSQMFTEKMKSQIQNLKKNDIIVFQDIKVRGPEGTRKIESISVTID